MITEWCARSDGSNVKVFEPDNIVKGNRRLRFQPDILSRWLQKHSWTPPRCHPSGAFEKPLQPPTDSVAKDVRHASPVAVDSAKVQCSSVSSLPTCFWV